MTKTNAKSAPHVDTPTLASASGKPTRRRASRKSAAIAPAPCGSVQKTSKRDQLAAMLLRDEGATIEQMGAALGWLPHTVRAALTGLKKFGYAIDSDKVDGLRTYRGVAAK